ncbi:hypothetical protein B0H10DRAFT_2432637 [Mycena sp. CBHHK59/15]|nr:hypothetical protein B0H10DRAFT_2432637 [Mycena sp. CBHHK59/15]
MCTRHGRHPWRRIVRVDPAISDARLRRYRAAPLALPLGVGVSVATLPDCVYVGITVSAAAVTFEIIAGGHVPKDAMAVGAIVPAPLPPICHALKAPLKGALSTPSAAHVPTKSRMTPPFFVFPPHLPPSDMADRDRDRRTASTARPGNIVNKAKQRRRTREEIEREAASKQQAKEEKEKNTAEKKGRAYDEWLQWRSRCATRTSMLVALPHAPTFVPWSSNGLSSHECSSKNTFTPACDTSASPAPSSSADLDTPMYGVADSVDPFNDGDDSDKDPDYVVPDEEVNPSEEENYRDQEDAGQGDIDDDAEIEAKIAAYEKNLRAKAKAKGKAPTKPQKGALRAEIQEQQGLPSGTAKRKAAEVAEPVEPAKKPKAAAGGLKANWQKDLGLDKPVKKSTTNWRTKRYPPNDGT